MSLPLSGLISLMVPGRPANEPSLIVMVSPTSKSISLRLPVALLDAVRVEANRRDVPYQSLIKVWLSEKVAKKTAA